MHSTDLFNVVYLRGCLRQAVLPKMHASKQLPMAYEKMHVKVQKELLVTFVP